MTEHYHCWHPTQGPILEGLQAPLWMTLRDGFIHQTCCECNHTRTVHRNHIDKPESRSVADESIRM